METIICPDCGAVNTGDREICFQCEGLLIELPVEPERSRKAAGSPFGSGISLIFFVFVCGFMYAISIPNISSARPKARTKACIANIKMLENALEMYDMDTPPTIEAETTVVCKYGTPEPVGLYPLADGGYVQRMPLCPTTGREDAYTVSRSVDSGSYELYVECIAHGTISNSRDVK